MPDETITLRTREGKSAPATAQVHHYAGSRLVAALWIGGGVLLGAASIIVPILHFFSVWALPLVGILLGLRALGPRAEVEHVRGACPACGEDLTLPGGWGEASFWAICSACSAHLEVLFPRDRPS